MTEEKHVNGRLYVCVCANVFKPNYPYLFHNGQIQMKMFPAMQYSSHSTLTYNW